MNEEFYGGLFFDARNRMNDIFGRWKLIFPKLRSVEKCLFYQLDFLSWIFLVLDLNIQMIQRLINILQMLITNFSNNLNLKI